MTTRYRCSGCGNVTRFDVVATRRTRAFHHFSVGGDLEIEDEEVLEERVETVSCRWCGATGDRIEEIEEPGAKGSLPGLSSLPELFGEPRVTRVDVTPPWFSLRDDDAGERPGRAPSGDHRLCRVPHA